MEAKKEGSSMVNYDKENYMENDKPKKKTVSE